MGDTRSDIRTAAEREEDAITERLVALGHDRSGVCCLCWNAAFRRMQGGGGKSQSEHYHDILAEQRAAAGKEPTP